MLIENWCAAGMLETEEVVDGSILDHSESVLYTYLRRDTECPVWRSISLAADRGFVVFASQTAERIKGKYVILMRGSIDWGYGIGQVLRTFPL
jgi:hypothetical protein